MINAEAQSRPDAEKRPSKRLLSTRSVVCGLAIFAVFGLICWLYAHSIAELSSARDARRNDDCAAAEKHLAACWRLPGLGNSIDLEEALLGVQQGDLTD